MRSFPALLLIAAVLTGCAAQASFIQDASGITQGTVTEAVSLYDPNSAVEAATHGAVRCFPLGQTGYEDVFWLGDKLVLLAREDCSTAVLTVSPESGTILHSAQFPFLITTDDPSFRCLDDSFSVFDPTENQLHRIDGNLQPLATISPPAEMTGTPILSADGSTLYYCTASAIRALDIPSGLSRIIKETAYPNQTVCGLHVQETVLQCAFTEGNDLHSLFLSVQNGSTIHIGPDIQQVYTSPSHHYVQLQQGNQAAWVYGDLEDTKQMLLTDSESLILPELHAALGVHAQSSGAVVLDYISLESGYRTATVQVDCSPVGFASDRSGHIWFLGYSSHDGSSALYCWDPALSYASDTKNYVTLFSARDVPDDEGISQCEEYARQLGSRYGIQVEIYEQATKIQPQGYQLTYEHLPAVIMKELKQLDKSLGGYPEGFLQTIEARFDGLTICLVRSLSGSCGPQEAANGLQFWEGHHAYIALAAGTDSQSALYHGLCHLIDTIVLNECSAYDTWNQLNPTGFEYDYDYNANALRNSTAYLLDTNRYFVDMFSMSFPKEDRARIMEYAMTPGNTALFQGNAMQAKLGTLCLGIREAFGLEDRDEAFLWEQYLLTPLAAVK